MTDSVVFLSPGDRRHHNAVIYGLIISLKHTKYYIIGYVATL